MIGLTGLGISFLTDLIGKYGEPLIAKGIEKVTGIDVTKKELTQEDKQKLLDSQVEIMKIDFEKLKEELPKLYYPNNKFEIITKADLVEWFS